MSKQEVIIICTLLVCIVVMIFFMTLPAKVRNERKIAAEPQNILQTGGGPGQERGFFSTPRGIAVDAAGNIYVADSKNHRIQKFNRDGNFVTAWGKEGAGPGEFREPCGIDVASDGTVYVADTWNGRVQVFSNTGSFLFDVGRDSGLWGPRDCAVDKEGNIYICDTGFGKIEKFDKNGRFLLTIGKKGGGKGPGEFIEPFGIKAGPDNNIYVLDRKNYRLQVLTSEGKYVREFKIDGWADAQQVGSCLMEPYLDIDWENKKIYISDPTNHRVFRHDLDGRNKKIIDKDMRQAQLMCPIGVAVFTDGRVLTTDHAAGKIAVLSAGN